MSQEKQQGELEKILEDLLKQNNPCREEKGSGIISLFRNIHGLLVQKFSSRGYKNHLELGKELAEKKDFEGAEREYRIAISMGYDPKSAHMYLGNLLSKKGDLDGAKREYKKIIEIDPKYDFPHYCVGRILERKGDLDGAIEECRKALEFSKENTPNRRLFSSELNCLLREKNRGKKQKIPQRKDVTGLKELAWQKDDANNAYAHYKRGIILGEEGYWGEAIEEYKKAIELNPNCSKFHSSLGLALGQKDYLEGEIDKDKPLNFFLDPNNAVAHNKLLEREVVEYKIAIGLDPNNAIAHNNLGVALWEKNDFEGAIVEFKKAMKINPNKGMYKTNLEIASKVLKEPNYPKHKKSIKWWIIGAAAVISATALLYYKPKEDPNKEEYKSTHLLYLDVIKNNQKKGKDNKEKIDVKVESKPIDISTNYHNNITNKQEEIDPSKKESYNNDYKPSGIKVKSLTWKEIIAPFTGPPVKVGQH